MRICVAKEKLNIVEEEISSNCLYFRDLRYTWMSR